MSASIIALLLPLVLAGTEAPLAVAHKIIAARCVACHDGDSVLDLRAPTPADEVRTWTKILEMVESSRMPPPGKAGAPEQRFPMDPAMRRTLVRAVSGILGAAIEPAPRVRHLSNRVWGSVVRELAGASLPAERVTALLQPLADLGALTGNDEIAPQHQLALDGISDAVCGAVYDAEHRDPAEARGLEAALRRARGPELRRIVEDVERRVLLAASPGAARDADEALVRAVYKKTGRARDAWTALCVSLLAGPRLLHTAYVEAR
jgi:hypothetical protein